MTMLDRLRSQLRRIHSHDEVSRQRSEPDGTGSYHIQNHTNNGATNSFIASPAVQSTTGDLHSNLHQSSAIRRGRLLNTWQEALLDTLLIIAGLILAWWLRYDVQLGRPVEEFNYLGLSEYTLI